MVRFGHSIANCKSSIEWQGSVLILKLFSNGLFRNALALYFVQFAGYIFPLLLLPFLTRKLGLDGYGKFFTFQIVASYGLVITDYGFQFSATRKIATLLDSGSSTSTVYLNVTSAKIILALSSLILMPLIIHFIPYVDLNFSIFMALLILVLGNAFTPLWLFQGYQRMVTVSLIVFFSKLGALILTFTLVRSPSDIGISLWAQSIGNFIPAFIASLLAFKLVGGLGKFSWAGIFGELLDGWPLFQTAIFSTLLTTAGVFILGLQEGPKVVGGYAAVERVAKGAASLLVPITQAIFPRVSVAFSRSYEDGLNAIKRFGKLLLLGSVFLSIFLITVYISGIIGVLFGHQSEPFAKILLVLAPWMVLGVVNNVLGIQYLSNIGQQKWYAMAFTIGSLTAIVSFFPLIYWYSYYGVAGGLVLGETLITAILGIQIKKAHELMTERKL